MLAIRLQRTGRSGHAQFRVIVQDSRFSASRGRVVSYLGSYNPHTKAASLDSQKAAQYLEHGAQPSDAVARLFQKEGIKLPGWVKLSEPKSRTIRNPEKRRATAPAPEAPAATAEEAPTTQADEVPVEEPAASPEATQPEATAEQSDEAAAPEPEAQS